jgi:hypothetical protein
MRKRRADSAALLLFYSAIGHNPPERVPRLGRIHRNEAEEVQEENGKNGNRVAHRKCRASIYLFLSSRAST